MVEEDEGEKEAAAAAAAAAAEEEEEEEEKEAESDATCSDGHGMAARRRLRDTKPMCEPTFAFNPTTVFHRAQWQLSGTPIPHRLTQSVTDSVVLALCCHYSKTV